MRQRFVLIEPKYTDPDTFCHFIVGSDRVRASIQIYADLDHLRLVAAALQMPKLDMACEPLGDGHPDSDYVFRLDVSVLPHDGADRTLRFHVFQELLDDGAPYRAKIDFRMTPEEALEFSTDLLAWCAKPEFAFIWKGD